jgi:hypothetical protein
VSLVLLLSVECRPYISLDKYTMEDPYSGSENVGGEYLLNGLTPQQ